MKLCMSICNRSVPLLSKEGLGEVLLDNPPSIPPFSRGEVSGYEYLDDALQNIFTEVLNT